MPTKLLAETLLRDINKAEQTARYLEASAKLAVEDALSAAFKRNGLLGEAKRQGIYFKQDPVTGQRELDPPTKGWDE